MEKKKMAVGVKLVLGFMAVALVTAIVGVIALYSGNQLINDIDTLAEESIPTILNLEKANIEYRKLQVALRTLKDPFLDIERTQDQFDNFDAARIAYRAALSEYEKLPRTTEEDELWKALSQNIADTVEKNNLFINEAKKLLQPGVDRMVIIANLERINVDTKQRETLNEAFEHFGALVNYCTNYYGKEVPMETIREAKVINNIILIVVIAAVLIAVTLGIVISQMINKPITKISVDLDSSSSNLESAALQVSSSGQELSSGSSELASSVEEITSSLEELQSVVESNTKNVNQSEIMMKETNQESQNVTNKMNELQKALNEINDNSKKIGKIIKVIDDIAFQTNILALNAAVEAARAGDAGKGFAVVAEQVKGLASKSAEAAKETADLIEMAIVSVSKGETLGNQVVDLQKKSSELTSKVSTLLEEINVASKEQLRGINQITQAVSQTNSVVQQTASSAEESAAAGEELLSQAESLNNVVDELNLLIKGKSERSNRTVTAKKTTNRTALNQNNSAGKKVTAAIPHHIEVVKPEDKIPMDDFSQF